MGSKDAGGQQMGYTGAVGQSDQVPDDEEKNPCELQDKGNRHQAGDEGADLEILVIFGLGNFKNHPDVGTHGSEAVGRGVAHSVKHLSESGVIAEHHEHRHEDRGKDGPLGRYGRDEQVDTHTQKNKGDEKRNSGKPDGLEGVGAGDCEHGVELGPCKQLLELAAEEAEDHIGTHSAHLFDHCPVDIGGVLKLSGCKTVNNAGTREKEEQDRDQAGQQRRAKNGAAAVLIDLGERTCKETRYNYGEIDQGGDTGVAQTLLLNVRDLLKTLLICTFISAETLVNDLIADKTDYNRAEEGGGHHVEPVTGDVDGEG